MSPRFASATTGIVRRNGRPDPLEGGDPGRAERLEEGEVRLDRGGIRGGGLEQQTGRTRSIPASRGREARRQGARIRVEAEAQDGADGGRPGCQALEVGRHQDGLGDGAGLLGGGLGTAVGGGVAGSSLGGMNHDAPELAVEAAVLGHIR